VLRIISWGTIPFDPNSIILEYKTEVIIIREGGKKLYPVKKYFRCQEYMF